MNSFTVAVFACLAIVANARPSGLWGGHASYVHVVPSGPTTLIGASGIVGPHGASGPSGSVNGHGAVGPSGEHNAIGHGYGGVALLGGVHGLVGIGHDDGQWHGEGLLESQDYAGHGVVSYGAPIAVGAPTITVAAHGYHGAHGLGYSHGW